MFHLNASGRKIYVPAALVDAYKAAGYWGNYADDIVGYDFQELKVESGEFSSLSFSMLLKTAKSL